MKTRTAGIADSIDPHTIDSLFCLSRHLEQNKLVNKLLKYIMNINSPNVALIDLVTVFDAIFTSKQAWEITVFVW